MMQWSLWCGRPACCLLIALAVVASPVFAQPTGVTEADPTTAIAKLRTELVDSFNKGDVDRLLSHLDPDVIVTWQNGEVCRGPQAVKAYYDKMMAGPNKIVAKLTANPTVDDRHVYGGYAVSWGNLHDSYVLNDGKEFTFDSRFTASIAKRGDVWKVTSFHASVNAFENPILGIAVKKVSLWVGIIAGVVGILAGALLGVGLARRKRAPAGA